jgi:hypothetical protein
MDDYFILSSKVGDKWAKVAPNMTSVKLGTCIHIVLDLVHFLSLLPSFIHFMIIHTLIELSRYFHVIVSEPVSTHKTLSELYI